MKLSVCVGIVTYNSAQHIEATLLSLVTAARVFDGEVRIVVWDNGSQDDTISLVERAVERYPELVALVLGGLNIGYGKGHNSILAGVHSAIYVICNPDIIVAPDFFVRSCAFLKDNPNVGLMSPRMTWEDGIVQHSNRLHPTIFDLLLRRFAPRLVKVAFRTRIERYEMADVGYDFVVEVPFCSGALMVCRRAALTSVGGFDERYFLYFEDADLSRMLQNARWRTVYNPDVVVIHGWQRAAHRSGLIAFVMIRNGVRYFRKWGWQLA